VSCVATTILMIHGLIVTMTLVFHSCSGMSVGLCSEVGFAVVGDHVAAMPYCVRTGRDGRSTWCESCIFLLCC
jgi:hypothetical protein